MAVPRCARCGLGVAPLLLSLLLSLSAAAAPPDKGQVQSREAELKALRDTIRTAQRELEEVRGRHDGLQRELRDAEREIGRVAKAVDAIERGVDDGQKRLAALEGERKRLKQGLNDQARALARQIRAAYAFGRQERVKLVLNQQSPATVSRMLTYYNYLNQARMTQIGTLRSDLAQLDGVEQTIRDENAHLAQLREVKAREADSLRKGFGERKRVLDELDREIARKGARLEQLNTNAANLDKLIASLREALARIPREPPPRSAAPRTAVKPFFKQRGALPWPVEGKLRARFGARREVGDLTWQGVLIAAPKGREVRAVARGRVAFADWMRGYGLLVIVDHGDGYLTLYAYNQSLYTLAGEWVEAGERIARVGDSGGQEKPGLYFEVRLKGQPVNPLRWLDRDATRVAGK